MAGWWESIKSTVKNAYCDVSDFATWYAAEVADLLDETKLDDLGEAQRDLFVYWNNLACGKSPLTPLPPAFEPSFSGGQCTNLNYIMRYNISYVDFTGIQRNDQFGNFSVGAVSGKVATATVTTGAISGNRTQILGTYFNENGDGGTGEINFSARNPNPNLVVNSIVMIPTSGVDNCGNPTGKLTPTNEPFTDTRDVTYTDEFGVEQTATAVQFTYGLPVVEPDGTISVPYEVCYDNFCFKGKTNFGDELVVKPEPPNQDALPPLQTVGEPTGEGTETPEPELDGEPLPPSEKDKKPILGVFIKSQKTGNKSKATEIFLGDYAPAILAPNIGFVRFRIAVGDEDGWLPDIPVKNVNAYVPVPDKLEAVEVKVEWQGGWKGKYLINRGKHCCQECEDAD